MSNPLKSLLLAIVPFLLGAAVVAWLLTQTGAHQNAPKGLFEISDFALIDHEGRAHQLSRYPDAKAFVIVTHGLGCNIVTKSTGALRDLQQRHDPAVPFFYLNANPQDDRDELAAHAEELGITIPILEDRTQLVLDELRATRTAEAFLIDAATRSVVFRGPIDDRLDYEAEKPVASSNYLGDAIESLLAGRPIAEPTHDSPGCLITREAQAEATPTYTEHVAPILERRCGACHEAGGIAPWEMDGYDTVRGWTAMMKEVLLTRRMPPWPADPHYGTFSNSLAATPEETRTLTRWIRDGAPRGPGDDPLETVRANDDSGWELGPPDRVLAAEEQHVPALGVVDYRYVSVGSEIEEDLWVRAVDLQPTDRSVVHHMFAFVTYPDHLKHLQPDWEGGVGGYFAVYGPGTPAQAYPEGTGSWIPAGSTLYLQVHYTTIGVETTDTPRLALYLLDEKPRHEILVGALRNEDFVLPPNTAYTPVTSSMDLEEAIVVRGLGVHMHYRGASARFDVAYPDGSLERLLSVPSFSFNWQAHYMLETPLRLPEGARLTFSGSFDNSRGNPLNPDPDSEVRWGLQSWEEMFLGYYVYTRETEEPIRRASR